MQAASRRTNPSLYWKFARALCEHEQEVERASIIEVAGVKL